MAFIDTMIVVRNGGLAIELEKALEEVVQGVRKTGKTGSLTLKLKVQAAEKGPDVDRVFLKDEIKVEVPQLDKKQSLFFTNDKGQLSRQDPRQTEMFEGLKEEVAR